MRKGILCVLVFVFSISFISCSFKVRNPIIPSMDVQLTDFEDVNSAVIDVINDASGNTDIKESDQIESCEDDDPCTEDFWNGEVCVHEPKVECLKCQESKDCPTVENCYCDEQHLICPINEVDCQFNQCTQLISDQSCEFGCNEVESQCFECVVDNDCLPEIPVICLGFVCESGYCQSSPASEGVACGVEGEAKLCQEGECIDVLCDDNDPCTSDNWNGVLEACEYQKIENCQNCENAGECLVFDQCVCEGGFAICPDQDPTCENGKCVYESQEFVCPYGCNEFTSQCSDCSVAGDCIQPSGICQDSVCTNGFCELVNIQDYMICGPEGTWQYCLLGECANFSCDDNNACTVDLFNPEIGQCDYVTTEPCLPCAGDFDCENQKECSCIESTQYCLETFKECVEGVCEMLLTDTNCQFGCNIETGECFECSQDVDCPDLTDEPCNDFVCSNGHCTQKPLLDGTVCGETPNWQCQGGVVCLDICDDENPCTDDLWVMETCFHEFISGCDVCESDEQCFNLTICNCVESQFICEINLPNCNDGVCQIETTVENCQFGCDPETFMCYDYECNTVSDCQTSDNVCKKIECQEHACVEVNKLNGVSCNELVTKWQCSEGNCVNVCEDMNPCTNEIWLTQIGECSSQFIHNCPFCLEDDHCQSFTACSCANDSFICNVDLPVCSGGVCQSEQQITPCEFGCHELTGECNLECYHDSDCNDSNPCSVESCVNNECVYNYANCVACVSNITCISAANKCFDGGYFDHYGPCLSDGHCDSSYYGCDSGCSNGMCN